MFTSESSVSVAEAGWLILGLGVAGFLVSWITTDLLHVGRATYIAVLGAVTAGATASVIAVLDVRLADLLSFDAAVVGLAAGLVVGFVLGMGLRKQPATLVRQGRQLFAAELWEGVVYGLSEGMLLSVLPGVVGWEAATNASWSTPGRWAAGLGASAAVIAVHHFGYWDFRSPRVFEALLACLALTVAYLATGSVLAPLVGHVVLHVAGITHGVALPPHQRPLPAVRSPQPVEATRAA